MFAIAAAPVVRAAATVKASKAAAKEQKSACAPAPVSRGVNRSEKPASSLRVLIARDDFPRLSTRGRRTSPRRASDASDAPRAREDDTDVRVLAIRARRASDARASRRGGSLGVALAARKS